MDEIIRRLRIENRPYRKEMNGDDMMKMEIVLDLHRLENTNCMVLDSQDIYKYIGENSKSDIELACYIDKFCQWLNWDILNTPTAYGDPDKTELRGWIRGYNYAKSIQMDCYKDRVELNMRGYKVTLYKPWKM